MQVNYTLFLKKWQGHLSDKYGACISLIFKQLNIFSVTDLTVLLQK